MRTRVQLDEEIDDETERLPEVLGEFERGLLETGPSFRLVFISFLSALGIFDTLLRLVLLRLLTARSLNQFGQDNGLLTFVIITYVLCVLVLAATTVIYLLTLVIVRPLEFLLEQLKK